MALKVGSNDVTTPYTKMYVGDTIVWQKQEPFEQYDYMFMQGNVSFTTSIYNSDNTTLEITMQHYSELNDNIFRNVVTGGNDFYTILKFKHQTLGWTNGANSTRTLGSMPLDSTYTIKLENGQIYVYQNGSQIKQDIGTGAFTTSTLPLTIGGNMAIGTANFSIKIQQIDFYYNNVKTHSLVPRFI